MSAPMRRAAMLVYSLVVVAVVVAVHTRTHVHVLCRTADLREVACPTGPQVLPAQANAWQWGPSLFLWFGAAGVLALALLVSWAQPLVTRKDRP